MQQAKTRPVVMHRCSPAATAVASPCRATPRIARSARGAAIMAADTATQPERPWIVKRQRPTKSVHRGAANVGARQPVQRDMPDTPGMLEQARSLLQGSLPLIPVVVPEVLAPGEATKGRAKHEHQRTGPPAPPHPPAASDVLAQITQLVLTAGALSAEDREAVRAFCATANMNQLMKKPMADGGGWYHHHRDTYGLYVPSKDYSRAAMYAAVKEQLAAQLLRALGVRSGAPASGRADAGPGIRAKQPAEMQTPAPTDVLDQIAELARHPGRLSDEDHKAVVGLHAAADIYWLVTKMARTGGSWHVNHKEKYRLPPIPAKDRNQAMFLEVKQRLAEALLATLHTKYGADVVRIAGSSSSSSSGGSAVLAPSPPSEPESVMEQLEVMTSTPQPVSAEDREAVRAFLATANMHQLVPKRVEPGKDGSWYSKHRDVYGLPVIPKADQAAHRFAEAKELLGRHLLATLCGPRTKAGAGSSSNGSSIKHNSPGSQADGGASAAGTAKARSRRTKATPEYGFQLKLVVALLATQGSQDMTLTGVQRAALEQLVHVVSMTELKTSCGKRGASWYSRHRLVFNLKWNRKFDRAVDFSEAREDMARQALRTLDRQYELMQAGGDGACMGSSIKCTHRCHIIARANGGADHPDNVIDGSASLNQRLGAKGDHIFAYLVGPEATVRAVRVSFPEYTRREVLAEAQWLVQKGEEAMQPVITGAHSARDTQPRRPWAR